MDMSIGKTLSMVDYIIITDCSTGANIAVLCIVCVCITLHTAKSGLEIIN